jgi:hypothetical protein
MLYMKKFNPSMFDSIKGALSNQEQRTSLSNILSMEPGNTYTVRLLPDMEKPDKTFFHYFVVGWESFSTGQYVQAVSPQTFGERDPIIEARYRIYKHGTDFEKERIKAVKKMEKWLVNAYVVDDSKNPENNGQVKIIRYGKQLEKIIRRAIDGEDSDEFGARIFDLGPNGVNFKIEVESQGEYPTYVSSRFTTHKADLGLSDSQISDIYSNVFDLASVFQIKSYSELENMFNEHFVGNTASSATATVAAPVPVIESRRAHDAPAATMFSDEDDDPIVAELLAGIGED